MKRPENGLTLQQRAAFDEGRRLGLAAIRALPQCGARAKGTGERCRRSALANGKCTLHGGLTPRGDDWHRPQLANEAGSVRKLDRKLKTAAKRKRKRDEKLAGLSPKELRRHERWQRDHPPTSTADRAARRRDREQARWLQDLVAKPKPSTPPANRTPPADAEARRRPVLIEIETAGGIFG